MSILDYHITLLTALVPPVIIVIGIPNCIFLINKYHTEFFVWVLVDPFRRSGESVRAPGSPIRRQRQVLPAKATHCGCACGRALTDPEKKSLYAPDVFREGRGFTASGETSLPTAPARGCTQR